MKLSLYSEYALLILIQLSRHSEALAPNKLAIVNQIPAGQLGEILTVLNQSGYLHQVKDQIQIAKSAGDISVAEIIRLFDGALAPFEPISEKGYATAPMENESKLVGLFEGIQEKINNLLENTTLAKLA